MLLLLSMLVLLTQPPRSWGAEVPTLPRKPLIDDCTLVLCSPVEDALPGRDERDEKEGAWGEKGDPGSPGATGRMGMMDVPKGDKSSPGEPGPKGYSGPRGPLGPAGVRGLAGREGLSRMQRGVRPQGEVGAPGVQGSAGTRGPPGVNGEKGAPDIAALRRQLEALQGQVGLLQGAFLQYKKVELYPNGRDVGQKVFKTAGFVKRFQEAEQMCTQAGGQLPSPRSAAENHALQQLVEAENKGNAFLSMTFSKAEGKFTYPGGEPLVYTNWAPGEPNNNGGNEYCVEMYTTSKWNDRPCGEECLVICEF